MSNTLYLKTKVCPEYFALWEQYSKKYGQKIALFYEMGGFYEFFGVENSKETVTNINQIAKDLNIRVGRVNKKVLENSRQNPLLAGIPSGYIKEYSHKAVKCGYTVIIYSQHDVINAKGKTVKARKLNKIISAGTDVEHVESEDAQHLVCVTVLIAEGELQSKKCKLGCALTCIDLTTGKVFAHSIVKPKVETLNVLKTWINGYSAKEILLNCQPVLKTLLEDEKIFLGVAPPTLTALDKILKKQSYQDEFLSKIYKPPSTTLLSPVEYIGMEKDEPLLETFLMMLKYIYEHDPTLLNKISKPIVSEERDHLVVTFTTLTKLGMTAVNNTAERSKDKSVFDIVNMTQTAMGKRFLKERILNPIIDKKVLEKRYDEIERMQSFKNSKMLDVYLHKISDMERFHKKIFSNRFYPCDLSSLDESYVNVLKIIALKPPIKPPKDVLEFKKLFLLFRNTFNYEEASKCSLVDCSHAFFKHGVHADLDVLFEKQRIAWQELKDHKDELSRYIDDVEGLKIQKTTKNGYYLTSTKKKLQNIPSEILNTLEICYNKSNVKVFSTVIKKVSKTLIGCKEKAELLNKNIFQTFLKTTMERFSNVMISISKYIARLDCVRSCALVAKRYNYCKPDFIPSGISATSLRHAISERIINSEFIANNVNLVPEQKGALIYGVNGGGKSVYLKSVGIAVIMAQAGMYVPARSFSFNPFRYLLTKVSMTDDIHRNKSTFQCEMEDLKDMIEKASPTTLCLADELCSGTTTKEAIGLVAAGIERLLKKEAYFIFTTHLHQLKDLTDIVNAKSLFVGNFEMHIKDQIVYGRRLKSGFGAELYGVEIAKHLGVGDSEFFKRVYEITRRLEGKSNELVSTKTSVYNSNVYMDSCELCGSTSKLQTDHILPQYLADEDGYAGGIHKNVRSNLRVLCEECHKKRTKKKACVTELEFID